MGNTLSKQNVVPWLVSAAVMAAAVLALRFVVPGEDDPRTIGGAAVGVSVVGEPMVRSVVCHGGQPTTLTVERFTRPEYTQTVARFEPTRSLTGSSEFPAESTSAHWRNTTDGFRVADQAAGELVVGDTGGTDSNLLVNAVRVTSTDWLGLNPGEWLVTDWTADAPVNKVLSAGELHEFTCG